MTTITIPIPDDRLRQLHELAAHFKVSPEELVRISVEELLSRPEEAFRRAVDEVINKNADLYQRLT